MIKLFLKKESEGISRKFRIEVTFGEREQKKTGKRREKNTKKIGE